MVIIDEWVPELTEAEVQTLIGMIELSKPVTTPNNTEYTFFPKMEADAKKYFGRFAVDWSKAYPNLIKKRLITLSTAGIQLTGEGETIASKLRMERPPLWYTYQAYYRDIEQSAAHSEFCKKVFGENLGQDGFADMEQLHQMIALLAIDQNSRVLDLGCGNGKMAEYISDHTGAQVFGIDYIPEAIRQAKARTRQKIARLSFSVGNMNDLYFPEEYFDAVISIDTFYMPKDLGKTVSRIMQILKRPGQMAAFYSQFDLDPSACASSKQKGAEYTELANVFSQAGIKYQAYDLSMENHALMRRKNQVAQELKNLYLQEGNEFLYQKMIRESLEAGSVYDAKTCTIRRYLYHALIK
ncbi:MAG TPA: class I SAM-dependent methyltransferase [Bacillota bacterium]|nr:class I SAM-dependent methyltransferase [Bacillota bacterium]